MRETVIAKYIRLSVEDAKTDSMSIANQRLMIDRHIDGLDIPDTTVIEFVDNGYSGTNFERPAVQELLELVRAGGINCIIVKDFSRFGRNAIDTGYFLERIFPLYRTRFISISDSFDSAGYEGNTGGMEVALKFLMHEYYSRDLSRKIKSAKHEKMRRGEHLTKNCVHGYKKVDNKLVIDEKTADTVRLIFNLALDNKSLSEIAAHLYRDKHPTPGEYKGHLRSGRISCVWAKSCIREILSDEQYIGTYIAGKTKNINLDSKARIKTKEDEWVKIPDHHPAIIEKSVFDMVGAIINKKGEPLRKRKFGTSQRYADKKEALLKGKVICGSCGHAMVISCTKNSTVRCQYTLSAPDMACHRLGLNMAELENTVLETVEKQVHIILNAKHLDGMGNLERQVAQKSEYERLISENNDAKQHLYERFILGKIGLGEYRANKLDIDTELTQLNQKRAVFNEKYAAKISDIELRKVAKSALKTKSLKQQFVDLLLDKIYVYPDNTIKIDWKHKSFVAM